MTLHHHHDADRATGRHLSAAALGAAALLVLTACAGGGDAVSDSPSGDAGQSADAGRSGGGAEGAEESAGSGGSEGDGAGAGGDEGGGKAVSAGFEPGDCLSSIHGARDVANFTEVDCSEEHNAEYLWSLPEQDPAATGLSEHLCRIVAFRATEQIDVFASATELTDTSDGDSQHCIVYSLEDRGWDRSIVDTDMTLDKAKETIDIDEEVGRT